MILLFKNGKQYKSQALLRDQCRYTMDFRALVRTPPDASISEPLVLLMIEGRSCVDVATFRRHDVETSQRCCLLTFTLVYPTSRRWDVMTWGRRDVGTSRRSSHFHAFLSIALICFQRLLFLLPLHLHSQKFPYSGIEL